MRQQLELLAPARDAEIGIAAIDCGADAVYIAGPKFGARQAAGNDISQIRELCSHAHRYGARVFVALNTILYDDELEPAYSQMLQVQEAGADAIIIQDMAILRMASEGIGNIRKDFHIPLHASTQCAIRTPEQAVFLESLGFSRLILERELSLEQIRAIRKAVSCELEFFVHGALCVCYSGQCYLSEHIAGRSANRGACIQACRSRYDLTDASGKVLVKDKALLSLKDFNLHDRLEELAEYIKSASLCGLGQTAPNPVLSTLRYFRDEYIAHIRDKKCPAGVCKKLLSYHIEADKCKGCTLCARQCPAGAIIGKVKEVHIIDNNKCVKCGACIEKCKFGAIVKK